MNGIKSLVDGDYCGYCDLKIDLKKQNFCPKCGNPLTDDAIKLKEQQNLGIIMGVIDDLTNIINDASSLQKISDYLTDKVKNNSL